jgi:hypothetical protein
MLSIVVMNFGYYLIIMYLLIHVTYLNPDLGVTLTAQNLLRVAWHPPPADRAHPAMCALHAVGTRIYCQPYHQLG